MTNMTGSWRLNRVALLAIILVAALATEATAAPSQATKDRCTAYAKRAVEQYQLMKAHPQCEGHTDPMTWQDSYENHYNGCLLFPESMAKMAEAGRDKHLQACGALSDGASSATSDPAAAAAAPEMNAGPPASPTAAAIGLPPSGNPAASSASAPGGAAAGQCSPRPPLFLQTMNPTSAGGGTYPTFGGDSITFTFIDPTAPAKRDKVTYKVRRPAFWLAYLKCTRGKDDPNWGYWVTSGDATRGPRYFSMGGLSPTLTIWAISPAQATQLLEATH